MADPANRRIERIERALASLAPRERRCDLCPRDCRVDRTSGAAGVCGSGARAGVASALLHYGEEPVLSGFSAGPPPRRGSGTIFFTGCNLKCLFCQNYQISWERRGGPVSDEALAGLMLGLQEDGAANINLVSPTHILLPVLRALALAVRGGLSLPIVWNSNGYEKVEIIERLRGIIDIYLPDCKYSRPGPAERYSAAPDYFEHARTALQEMFLQQPDLDLDEGGLARRGTIVRHLVLPGHVDNTLGVLDWLRATFPASLPISLMSQYRPCFRAPADLDRPLAAAEYREVLARARSLGFEQLFIQPESFAPDDHLNPDFDRKDPFSWKKRR